jgi:hypothetical protein
MTPQSVFLESHHHICSGTGRSILSHGFAHVPARRSFTCRLVVGASPSRHNVTR